MASFLEELWNSVFTPGPTPTLLVATNATFAALQLLLIILLVATYSIHFVVLSVLCAGLWFSINWFAREIQMAKEEDEAKKAAAASKKHDKPTEAESDTETEAVPEKSMPPPPPRVSSLVKPQPAEALQSLRKRQSMGDSSGYVSTDSEWDKVSDVGDKER